MDNETVLNRTIALCEQAVAEKNAGNVALLNKIGGNGGLQTFFANAFSVKSVQYNYFHKQFPVQWKEIVGFWEAVDKEELKEAEQVSRLDGMDARFDKLEGMLKEFIESQKPADEKPAAKKPVKKGKQAADVTEEADTEGEASEEA